MNKKKTYSVRSKSLFLKLSLMKESVFGRSCGNHLNVAPATPSLNADEISDDLIDEFLQMADKIRHIEKLEEEKLVPRHL